MVAEPFTSFISRKNPPHSPNLQDDYQKIYNAALQTKQAEIFDEWLDSAKKNIYIDIKPTECSNALQNWLEPTLETFPKQNECRNISLMLRLRTR